MIRLLGFIVMSVVMFGVMVNLGPSDPVIGVGSVVLTAMLVVAAIHTALRQSKVL